MIAKAMKTAGPRSKPPARKTSLKSVVGKVTGVVKQFTAWSYSRYKDHRDCPRYAHWKHILKKPEGPKSPAMQRGGDIHKEAEHYVGGCEPRDFMVMPEASKKLYEKRGGRYYLKKVPASAIAFKKEMEELRKGQAIAEGKWGLTNAWKPIDFFDWARCWCRLVLDAHFMPTKKKARVIDFKTGKVYFDDNAEQMELYAVGAVEYYPTAEEVDVELWYFDQPRSKGNATAETPGNPMVKTYNRKQVQALQGKWRRKVVPILMDKRFVPTPGQKCRWCDYSKAKGGDCEF